LRAPVFELPASEFGGVGFDVRKQAAKVLANLCGFSLHRWIAAFPLTLTAWSTATHYSSDA
jgi:hypothetical protein